MSTARALLTASLLGGALMGPAGRVHAQFTDPCGTGCALTLGATSYVFAMGTSAAIGRANGGFSTIRGGILTWGVSFAAAAGSGIALYGDGGRQRRAVYGSAIGAAAGSFLGLAIESITGEGSSATRLAATLIGAGIGVAAGGAVGALTYDGVESEIDPSMSVLHHEASRPAFTIRVTW